MIQNNNITIIIIVIIVLLKKIFTKQVQNYFSVGFNSQMKTKSIFTGKTQLVLIKLVDVHINNR